MALSVLMSKKRAAGLRATLSSSDAALREAAVRLLARAGDRDFANRDLSKADLSRSEVSSASFRVADLRATNFDEAVIIESDFEGADVTDATMHGAMLTLTNLDRAKGWETVTCDELTSMPERWECIEERPHEIAR